MPSRRSVLASSGVVLAGVGFAGCLSEQSTVSAEVVQLKSVRVEWERDGRSSAGSVVQLVSEGETEITGQVATDGSGLVSSPTDVTVSEAHHDRLTTTYDRVRYVVGLCGDELGSDDGFGCLNADASREDFNDVQFGDRADVEVRDGAFVVHEVERGDVTEWDADVREFEWDDRYPGPSPGLIA